MGESFLKDQMVAKPERQQSKSRQRFSGYRNCLRRISGLLLASICFFSFPHSTASAADGSAKSDKKSGKRKAFRNLPDMMATPPAQTIWQQEVNVYQEEMVSNTTVEYGLPQGLNIGFSLLNVAIYNFATTHVIDPSIFLNVDKAFILSPLLTVVAGTQAGTNPAHHAQPASFENFSYVDLQTHGFDDRLTLHGGLYYGNRALTGTVPTIGYQFGIELALPRLPGWSVVGEHVSGHNSLSAELAEVVLPISPHWRLGLGVQIPAAGSGNDFAGLVEINSR